MANNSNGARLTTQIFKERASKVHNGFYHYDDDLEYVNYSTKVPIICPIHGRFFQKPSEHLHGKGCKLCGIKRTLTLTKKTKDKFIADAIAVHDHEYSYVNVDYIDSKTKVEITCKKHGPFFQTPDKHINGKEGCPLCYGKTRYTTKEMIDRFKETHGDKYDYSKVSYINNKSKVEIICHNKDANGNEHGPFFQNVNHHIWGSGCPKCNQSHLENDVEKELCDNGVEYEKQKMFKWLGKKKLDFYLPTLNIAIECQGEQHYKPIKFFGGECNFKIQHERDELKRKQCTDNGITILYYTNSKLAKNGEFTSTDKLMEKVIEMSNDRHDDNG